MYCPQCGERIGEVEPTEASPTAATQALHPAPQTVSQPAPTQALPSAPHASGLTGVADNVRERVEKIRHVSSVVIDQAAYDPSLRFLLVAAFLFVLFLLLLIFSKVIG
jgi:hypothetical protein